MAFYVISSYESADGGSGWGSEIDGGREHIFLQDAVSHAAEVARDAMIDHDEKIVVSIVSGPGGLTDDDDEAVCECFELTGEIRFRDDERESADANAKCIWEAISRTMRGWANLADRAAAGLAMQIHG